MNSIKKCMIIASSLFPLTAMADGPGFKQPPHGHFPPPPPPFIEIARITPTSSIDIAKIVSQGGAIVNDEHGVYLTSIPARAVFKPEDIKDISVSHGILPHEGSTEIFTLSGARPLPKPEGENPPPPPHDLVKQPDIGTVVISTQKEGPFGTDLKISLTGPINENASTISLPVIKTVDAKISPENTMVFSDHDEYYLISLAHPEHRHHEGPDGHGPEDHGPDNHRGPHGPGPHE